jgi:hypothetical protein
MSALNIGSRYREPPVLIVPSVAGFPVVVGSATSGRCLTYSWSMIFFRKPASTLGSMPEGRLFRDHALSTMLGLATIVAVLWMIPCADAAAAGYQISAARAAAIHACSVLASRYPQHDWGNTEIYLYRSCMAVHGQGE